MSESLNTNIVKFNKLLLLLFLPTIIYGCSNNSSNKDAIISNIKMSRNLSEEISLSNCKFGVTSIKCDLMSPYRSYSSLSFGYYVYSKNGVLMHSGAWPLFEHVPKGIKTRVSIVVTPLSPNPNNWGSIFLRIKTP